MYKNLIPTSWPSLTNPKQGDLFLAYRKLDSIFILNEGRFAIRKAAIVRAAIYVIKQWVANWMAPACRLLSNLRDILSVMGTI